MRNLKTEEEIIASWKGDIEAPLVSICCLAFNHEAYIKDALEGFLIQETDFPFEILIHDDASIDRTADIIREYEAKYPKLIKPIYQTENQYSQGIKITPTYNFPRVKGEYIAMCEGDDYWISTDKLQIQVSHMINDSHCSLSFHRARIEQEFDLGVNDLLTKDFGVEGTVGKDSLFFEGGSSAPTASMIFKSEVIKKLPRFFNISPVGDMPLKLMCSIQGSIYYFPEIMSVRRIGTPGSWNIRTRLDDQKQNTYLLDMMSMLEEFNLYTDSRWVQNVEEQLVVYAMKLNRLGLVSWVNIKEKYPSYWESLSVRDKLIFNLRILKARMNRLKGIKNAIK